MLDYNTKISNQLFYPVYPNDPEAMKPEYNYLTNGSRVPVDFEYEGKWQYCIDLFIKNHHQQFYNIIFNAIINISNKSEDSSYVYDLAIMTFKGSLQTDMEFKETDSEYLSKLNNKIIDIVVDRMRISTKHLRRKKLKGLTFEQLERLDNGEDIEEKELKEEYDIEIIDTLTLIYKGYIKTFWNIGLKIGVIKKDRSKSFLSFFSETENDEEPNINFDFKTYNHVAYYSPQYHSITINKLPEYNDKKKVTRDDIDNLFEDIRQGNTESKIYKLFFGWLITPTTIIHELEHARRGTSHNEAGHSNIKKFYSDAQEQQLHNVIEVENPESIPFNLSASIAHYLIMSDSNFTEELKRNTH
jgi:hypothetical protein